MTSHTDDGKVLKNEDYLAMGLSPPPKPATPQKPSKKSQSQSDDNREVVRSAAFARALLG